LISPHPALSKRRGLKKREVKVLSFGEDLGEATSTSSGLSVFSDCRTNNKEN